ncbi:predicted protein [Lichtheimia corymbifera JMRC:FSU:9682]|uniref:Uncharacterized protein n=1 Tax=Lichtheimia corymbifera JMRC:FSU:9682 TaxID=1263082 RepID=A0A068RT65_9FUNG|nr:predicted protein [Lichtheimia corymbifera JMRC:FSU:9682]
MLECNLKAASKNSDTNGCYKDCMNDYWPQPYAATPADAVHDDNDIPGPPAEAAAAVANMEEQEEDIEEENEEQEETQPENLDSPDDDEEEAVEEESDDLDNAIDRVAEPDQVSNQEVTQEDDQAASDKDNFVLVAAAAQEGDSSTVEEAYHKDDNDDHHDSHQQPTSMKGGHPVATVTAYTTSHVTVMPDGQPLPTSGHGVPNTSGGASHKLVALFSITLPMLIGGCMLSLFI